MTAGSLINTSDNRLNYFIADTAEPIKFGEIYKPKVLEDQSRVDYSITTTEDPVYKTSGSILDSMRENVKTPQEIEDYCNNFDNNMKQKKLSYMNVKNVEEGADWYKTEFPKLPDDLCDIMARWNWGELETLTKKKLKNDKVYYNDVSQKAKEMYDLHFTKEEYLNILNKDF